MCTNNLKTMKNSALFLLATLMHLVAMAQLEFAPVGATWYYTETDGPLVDYILMTCVSDSTANGITYKTLVADQSCLNGDTQVLAQKGDSVFWLSPAIDTFQLLYDFGAQEGDNWPLWIKDDPNDDTIVWNHSVDSTWIDTINGYPLRAMRVTYGNYTSTVIEQFGNLKYLLYLYNKWEPCDLNYPHGLRCYSDSIIGHYETGIADSCTYSTVGVAETFAAAPVLSPNPFVEELVLGLSAEAASIQILGLDGALHFTAAVRGQREISLNLSHLPPAVYLVRTLGASGEGSVQKAVKLAQ